MHNEECMAFQDPSRLGEVHRDLLLSGFSESRMMQSEAGVKLVSVCPCLLFFTT
jgi:hypothetical protein